MAVKKHSHRKWINYWGSRQSYMNLQSTRHRIFKLDQNHPNPVVNKTTIPFVQYQNEMMELAIYNIVGQKVKTLVEGFLQKGSYLIDWDGREHFGKPLGWGDYIYKLQARTGQVKFRKLTLLC